MLAGLLHGVGGFRDAPTASTAGPGPRKEKSRGTPDLLSHNTDRWALHLLQRGRSEERADASPAARISLFIADVRASLRPAFRPKAAFTALRASSESPGTDIELKLRGFTPDLFCMAASPLTDRNEPFGSRQPCYRTA